jgi:predicted nuclease of predicted toxin-antitoxin system
VRAHVEPAAITLTAVNVTEGHEEAILAAAVRIAQAALGEPAGA